MGGPDPKIRTVVFVEALEDDMSGFEKERIARRRVIAATGHCPCGAVLELPDPVPGKVLIVPVEHEVGCPAIEPSEDL